MKKMLVLIMVLLMAGSLAFAEEAKTTETEKTEWQRGTGKPNPEGRMRHFVDENKDGINDNFVDKDKDGKCDNFKDGRREERKEGRKGNKQGKGKRNSCNGRGNRK